MKVCVIAPHQQTFSETFIHDHRKNLSGEINFLYEKHGWWHDSSTGDPLSIPRLRRYCLIMYNMIKGQSAIPEYLKRKSLQCYFRQREIDVVLCEYGTTAVKVMGSCQELDLPMVVHFHGFDVFRKTLSSQLLAQYETLFSQAEALVSVSEEMSKKLLELGAPEEKIYQNSCGVDTTKFQGSDPEHAPPEFLFVSRLRDFKGPHLVILAFQKVLSNCPESRLTIIGEGDLMSVCRHLVTYFNIESNVRFLGSVSHDRVAEEMKRARALVQHSIETSDREAEGFGLSVAEAGASGLPAIGTRCGGIKDIIVEGETGYLVEEGAVDEMAKKMTHLVQHPEVASELGRRARKRVKKHFSQNKQVQRLENILHSSEKNRKRS